MEVEHFESLYPEDTRSSEIEKALAYVKEGSSCQLIGLPGVGRSSILGLLAYNKKVRMKHLGERQTKMHFVPVDFSEIRNRTLFDAMKFLFLSLADSLRERKMHAEYVKVTETFKESLSFQDELVLFQGLKEIIDYLALERKLSLVFLFDRFEEYIPAVTSEFFANLRVLRNRARYHFSVIFSLSRPLEDILEPALLVDFYEFVAGHVVYVQLYDAVATEFRVAYIEQFTGKQLPESVEEDLLLLTGGYPKITKLAVEAVLASFPSEQKEKDKKEREVLENFLLGQKTVRRALMEVWLSLAPAEQSDLLQGSFEDSSVDHYLFASGLVKDKKIQVPLFDTFIHAEFSDKQIETTKIVYDENTNTIRKGEAVLSDSLTSSEFRLLRYLLSNQERVVERDEIVSVVWEGVKSTAGITEQAVDQLIFRLRRKIEEDPNTPTHLQTVKGRGVKFAA
jgi:DNA-binding winged helix-turn-helix (wHTH) protein